MKLLVLSDLHSDCSIIGRLQEKIVEEEVAILTVCGDLTHFGDLCEATEILKELIGLAIPVLFVPGNCDSKDLASIHSIYGAINLHAKCIDLRGLHFFGIGGCPPGPFHTPFEIPENEITHILHDININTNWLNKSVLVSHAPPANTKIDITRSGIHAGSQAIREFIEMTKPFLVICGHIHEARGKDIIDETFVVNPGSARMGYFAIIDIDRDITVHLEVSQ